LKRAKEREGLIYANGLNLQIIAKEKTPLESSLGRVLSGKISQETKLLGTLLARASMERKARGRREEEGMKDSTKSNHLVPRCVSLFKSCSKVLMLRCRREVNVVKSKQFPYLTYRCGCGRLHMKYLDIRISTLYIVDSIDRGPSWDGLDGTSSFALALLGIAG
jgi:hypothetical protein